MALSETVKVSVQAANDNMREALAFAARNENPLLISSIAEVISKIEALYFVDHLVQDVEEHILGLKK